MSTFRAQLRQGCFSVIQSVQSANSGVLAHVYDHRPQSYRTPCAFVDNNITQPVIDHDSGTRRRDLVAAVHIVNKLISNDQAADEQDVLVDRIVDAFTAQPRAASSASLIEPVSVDGHEEQDGEASYACSIVFVRGRIMEGRS